MVGSPHAHRGWRDRHRAARRRVADALGRGAGGRPAPHPPGGRRRRAPGGRPSTRWSWGWNDERREHRSRHAAGRSSASRRPTRCEPLDTAHRRRAACATTRAATSTAASSPTSPAWRSASTPRSWRRWRSHAARHAHPARQAAQGRHHATEGRARLDCTFFNAHKVQHVIKPGLRAVFSGKVGVFSNKLQLTHPQFEPLDETEDVRPFLSVYPATAGVTSQQMARCVRQVLDAARRPHRPAARAALRRAKPRGPGAGAAADPRAGVRGRHPRRAAPPRVGRGDGRAARAGAAPAGHRPAPGRGVPARARAACSTRSTRGCRSRSPRASTRSAPRSPPTSPASTR